MEDPVVAVEQPEMVALPRGVQVDELRRVYTVGVGTGQEKVTFHRYPQFF